MLNNWRNIHSEFANELQQKWEAEGFAYEETRSWINVGLKPTEYKLASYIRRELGYKPEEVLNFADLPTLRTVYQESLNDQLANLQIHPIREPETVEDEPIPEIPPAKPTLQEELDLTRALMLSLDIEDDDIDSPPSSSSEEEEEEINWEKLEPYLSEKRLNLKKYFVFNLGKEVMANSEITVSDSTGETESESIPNIREVKPLLTEHLTQLFNDGNEKAAISFTGKHTNHLSLGWSGEQLNRKIKNGEEVYIIFDKSKIKANSSYIRSKASSVTQLGPMDWPEIIILAVEARPQVRVFQSKKNTLKFLKNNDPVLSGKKNLYEWWKEEKKFADNQKENLEKMGMDGEKDSLDWYNSEELSRMLKYEEIAKQNKNKLPFEKGGIKKMFFLSPPRFQDKDCAVVVSQGKTALPSPIVGSLFPLPILAPINDFGVFLLVYEEPWKNISNNLYVKRVKSYSEMEEAEEGANKLVNKLTDRSNAYPVCAVFEKVEDVFEAFSPHGDIEGVKGFVVPWSAKSNPDGYFKPFDIVRVENPFYSHVGIYLGKDKNGKHKAVQVSKKLKGLYITDWEELFSNKEFLDIFYSLSRYHPFVTYKKARLIRKHIARAYSSGEYNGAYALLFGANNYEKGNCQHFANRAVLGLNISNEGTLFKKNKLLKEEIDRTTQHFNNLRIIGNNRKFHYLVRKAIRGFAERVDNQDKKVKLEKTGEGKYTARIIHNPLWSWKQPVELKPSDNCKIQ